MLFPTIQRGGAETPIVPATEPVLFVSGSQGNSAMLPLTGPYALGLVSVPLLSESASSSGYSEQRLTADARVPGSAPSPRKSRKSMLLAVALIAVSFASVPASYAIQRHLYH